MRKVCSKCREEKPVEAFHRAKATSDGRHTYCADCKNRQGRELYSITPERRKDYSLKQHYGISLTDYQQMLTMQASGCAICGEWPGCRALHVDHCHETGDVRGLLCHGCNVGIGHLRDDPGLLERAAQYIRDAGGGESNSQFK